jgi:hypothetical protein
MRENVGTFIEKSERLLMAALAAGELSQLAQHYSTPLVVCGEPSCSLDCLLECAFGCSHVPSLHCD